MASLGANITSLGFRQDHIDNKASLSRICASSHTLPSLRHVYFDVWHGLSNFWPWSMDQIPENMFNITDICFYRCDIPDHELDWIISRTRMLRSFRYYTNWTPDEDDEDYVSPPLSEEQLRRSLSIHRLTLEEVVISILYDEGSALFNARSILKRLIRSDYAEIEVRKPITFREFPILKRLRINLEYVVPGFPLGSRYSGRDHRIIESLPQTLEVLSLEYLEKSVYRNTTDAQATQQYLKRLFRYIEELEIDARSQAPVIMSVSLGDRKFDLHKTMNFFAGLTDVNKNFEARGVALSAHHPRELRGFGENKGARMHGASSFVGRKN